MAASRIASRKKARVFAHASKPIQLTDAALRKATGNTDAGIGIGLCAADIVPAAELIEAEYAAVRDVDDKLEFAPRRRESNT